MHAVVTCGLQLFCHLLMVIIADCIFGTSSLWFPAIYWMHLQTPVKVSILCAHVVLTCVLWQLILFVRGPCKMQIVWHSY